jgi:arylsulfatase B
MPENPTTRRRFLGGLAAGASAALLPGGCTRPGADTASPLAPGERRPNVLLIFVDDLGYGELGCQGNPQIPTPHIDAIAERGIRFTSGYVSAPYCSPSRAGLLTGRYQTRFGHERNFIGKDNLDPDIGLPTGERTLADALRDAGYATGLVGKWHLGGTPEYHPQARGFDEFFGFLHEGHFYVPPPYDGVVSHLREKEPPYDANNPILRGRKEVREDEYLTDALTREALAFIDRHRDEPFFLYLSYNAIHSPMQAKVDDVKRFAHIEDEHRRVFAGMLAALDRGVGAVMDRLRDLGLARDTLVFFISDNGGPPAELTSSNAPLRGGKGRLWEGGIRTPFIVQWTGRLPAGVTDDRPVIALDVYPTALAAAGMAPEPGRTMDGVNLLPYLAGDRDGPPHEELFWRYRDRIALRRGKWKLIRQDGPMRLFDLSRDIGETNDLMDEQPEVARAMRERLDAINAEMVAPLWR